MAKAGKAAPKVGKSAPKGKGTPSPPAPDPAKTEDSPPPPTLDLGLETWKTASGKILQAVELIRQAHGVMAPFLRGVMTGKQRRALVRQRKAVTKLIPEVMNVLNRNPALAPQGTSAEEIAARYETVQTLHKVMAATSGTFVQLSDTYHLMEVELYKLSLDIYAIAKRGRRSGDTEILVRQMEAALKLGPRSPRFKVETLEKPVRVKVPPDKVEAALAIGGVLDRKQPKK